MVIVTQDGQAKINLDAKALASILQGGLPSFSKLTGEEHIDLQIAKLQDVLHAMAKVTARISPKLLDAGFELTTLPATSMGSWKKTLRDCWEHLRAKQKQMKSGKCLTEVEMLIINEWLKKKPCQSLRI